MKIWFIRVSVSKVKTCAATPSPLMGEGWGEGVYIAPLPAPLPQGEREPASKQYL